MNNISKSHQDSQEPLISVNLVVHNGEKYVRQCLDSVLRQTYKNIEVNILDNASTDKTLEIIKLEIENCLPASRCEARRAGKLEIPNFSLIQSKRNWGTWPGQEELLKYSHGKYIVALSVDIILNENFVTEAVKVFEKDEQVGAVQPKVFKYELNSLNAKRYPLNADIIDTCGFKIFRSRRIVNIGHGEKDCGQYDKDVSCFAKATQDTAKICLKQIFAVEGAVPVLRRQALDDCRLESQGGRIIDPDFFWYGDDLDLAWRMRLFGWKQVFAPAAIAYHDRQTTKALAGGSWREFVKIRKTVPMFKRRLDWRNTTLAIIKNDFASNLLRDSYYILWRQLRLWGYFILFEPAMILEKFRVAKLLPKMLKRRGEIMRRVRVSAKEMRKWFG